MKLQELVTFVLSLNLYWGIVNMKKNYDQNHNYAPLNRSEKLNWLIAPSKVERYMYYKQNLLLNTYILSI